MPSRYLAAYNKTGLTADTFALLIDKSSTAYPYAKAVNTIILEEVVLSVIGTAGAAGNAVLYLGVVKENDATDGTYWKLAAVPVAYNTETLVRICFGKDGVNITLTGTPSMQEAVATVSGNETGLQNDAGNLEDALGNTDKSAGAGDLIVHLDEGTDGGTYTINATAIYRVQ